MSSRIAEKQRDNKTLAPLISAILRVREKELAVRGYNVAKEDTAASEEIVSLVMSQPDDIIQQLREDKGFDHDPDTLHFPAVRKEAYDLAKLILSKDEAPSQVT